MKTINILLLGYGNVGKAFVRLIHDKQDLCLNRHRLLLRFGYVLNSRGALRLSRESEGKRFLADSVSGLKLELHPGWESGKHFRDVLECRELDVLVDCTPSNIWDGEPAIGYTRRALERRLHVVTSNKGPLVVDFDGIRRKAAENRVSLGMSGATAAALPTLDVALRSTAGAEISRVEGILNGTSNYILTRMNEGIKYSDALREARESGIAEPDPSKDVEGWDTAAKLLIITNAVFETAFTLEDIHVEGITGIPLPLMKKTKGREKKIKLIGRCFHDGEEIKLETGLSLLDPSHPLYWVDGTQKGITFFTDTMDMITVSGGKSNPLGAAAAMLKDIINIYRLD